MSIKRSVPKVYFLTECGVIFSRDYMNHLSGLIFGVIITSLSLFIYSFFHPSIYDSLIKIEVINDTKAEVEKVIVKANNGQTFSCTLKYDRCLFFIQSGDTDFKIHAILESDDSLIGSIGYAESGSEHSISISNLNAQNQLTTLNLKR